MDIDQIKKKYTQVYSDHLIDLAQKIEGHLQETFKEVTRIDKITARPKSMERFVAKAMKKNDDGNNKYVDPLNQIQDQIGARIVTYYSDDIPRISKIVEDYYPRIESQTIVPDKVSEFGYEGKHYILFIPEDILPSTDKRDGLPNFFELQIKTLFQHAWSEANHDLGYKPDTELTKEEKRKIAFTAAQAWGADLIFNELKSS